MSSPTPLIDLTTQRLEQIRHELHLVDHHETAHLLIEIQVRFFQYLTVGNPFHVEIDSVAIFRDI